MTNTDFAFGIDLSRYNTSPDGKTKVDFDVIAAHEPEVVFIAMGRGSRGAIRIRGSPFISRKRGGSGGAAGLSRAVPG